MSNNILVMKIFLTLKTEQREKDVSIFLNLAHIFYAFIVTFLY